MRSLVKCVVASVLLLAVLPARGQPNDPLATKLGFGARSDALPAWSEPTLAEREELAAFIDQASQGVLLVGYRKPVPGTDRFESGTGTAWVLSSKHRLLATNAHVADMIVGADGRMMAIVNGTTYMYRVARHWYHPGVLRIKELGGGQVAFVHSTDPAAGDTFPHCPDLAVLQLSEDGPDLPFEWQMATPDELQHLFARPVAILGFPGDDTPYFPDDGETAVATFHDGTISRLTDFQGSVNVPYEDRQWVQYTMSTFPGFSGSPVFLANGHVVAVHNSAPESKNPNTGQVIAKPHGIRIDCLWELLVYHGLDRLVALPVDRSQVEDRVQRWLQPHPEDEAVERAYNLLLDAARLIYIDQDYQSGIDRATQALAALPAYARPYFIRAHGYVHLWFFNRRQMTPQERLRVLQQAQADIEEYIRRATNDPDGLVMLCAIANNLGLESRQRTYHTTAVDVLNKLLATDNLPARTRARALSNRGIALDNLGYDEQALEDHNAAVAMNPDDPILFENRADFWRVQGRNDLAEEDRARAAEARRRMAGR